jgi:enamine deaminase RidA (YjgF/YER057c/UK114 family)
VSVEKYGSGGPWEAMFGYSRVVAAGPLVLTAGCTATVDGSVVHPGDAAGQARVAFGIALDAMAKAGVTASDVIRTRIYMVRSEDCDAVGRVHGQIFGDVRPATTMVIVAKLIAPDHLVEVEVEAYRPERGAA